MFYSCLVQYKVINLDEYYSGDDACFLDLLGNVSLRIKGLEAESRCYSRKVTNFRDTFCEHERVLLFYHLCLYLHIKVFTSAICIKVFNIRGLFLCSFFFCHCVLVVSLLVR